MDNKKPLIIVPPMSESLTKLKEILDGVASEENIEIYVVDDAKEFGQLVGSGGQALILMNNAKVCATLLQEFRTIIAKNHSKVILFTPKEIPIKTLQKFAKIGLTESILESSPPKTLLYKVKLLLRSLKVTVKEDQSQQVIKTMLETGPKTKIADEVSEENVKSSSTEETADEVGKKKKRSDDDSDNMDYLSNMKGKVKASEDAIETHWKTKKERKNTDLDLESSENNQDGKKSSQDDIDMYYRGKKSNSLTLDPEENNDEKRRKKILEEEEEVADYSLKKQRETIVDLEPEEKKSRSTLIDENDNDYFEKKQNTTLEEEIEKEKKKSVAEEVIETESRKKNSLIEDDSLEEAEKNNKEEQKEDLGGYLKGKISNQESVDADEDFASEKNSMLENEIEIEKKKKMQLEEEQESETRRKSEVLEQVEEKAPNEGETDHIDTYMRGKNSADDVVNELMIGDIDTKKKTKQEDEDEESNKNKKEAIELEFEENNENDKKSNIADDEESSESKRKMNLEEEESKDYKKEAMSLSDDDESNNRKNENETVDAKEKDINDNSKSLKLDDSDGSAKEFASDQDEGEDFERKNLKNTNLDLDKSRDRNSHDGKADKISTYYKSGESSDKEHDWDLKKNKKDTKLDILKNKSIDNEIAALTKKTSQDEQTIDYRKMKAEFDQISRGELVAHTEKVQTVDEFGKIIFDAENSSRVVEMTPTAFDFAIEIISLIYAADVKSKEIIKTVAEKLLKEENAFLSTSLFSTKDGKFNETFSSYNEFTQNATEEIRNNWNEIKVDEKSIELFSTLSMPTYLCREIPDGDSFWRDLELPTWASKELTNKKVELIYPFFDGVTRVGYAHLYFPTGIIPSNDKKIQIIIEMLRCVFLENTQKSSVINKEETEESKLPVEDKKGNVLSMFGGLFGKKKVG